MQPAILGLGPIELLLVLMMLGIFLVVPLGIVVLSVILSRSKKK